MKVPVVANPKFSRPSQLKAAVDILNANQSSIFFELIWKDAVPVHADCPVINSEDTRHHIAGLLSDRNNIAIITDSQFVNNWFSVVSNRGSVISTYSWEEKYSPPALKTYLQMELILHVVACAADLTEQIMESMSHDDSIGCLFDFCQWKPDVRFKIIGGHICETCAGKLRGYGLNEGQRIVIGHLLDIMRLDSIGRANNIRSDKVFTAMRFTKNDANDHSFLYGVKPAFETMGLCVTRADKIADSGILINKIFRMIDEAWAVIVLSGTTNPNVLFEYGYAVGKKKPIFLVTPSSGFADSPTDIKGFEHILYAEGDFEGLKDSLISCLRALPRFS